MAKFYNNRVKTGRLAGSVFAVRNGETIERAYQPMVANPQTPAQIEARAKLKLLSQLAAVVAPVIAIPRQGAVSSRNLFTKVNYSLTTYSGNEANIDIAAVQLTKSVVALPAVTATRSSGGGVTAGLQSLDSTLSRVVYALVAKIDDRLHVVATRVATAAGATGPYFATSFPSATSDEAYVLAYGVRDNSEKSKTRFGNLVSPTGEDIAKIIVTSELSEMDLTTTITRGTEVVPEG